MNFNMNQFGNMANMMKQYNAFKQVFTGDPKEAVMNLMNNGQMSKQQFEQLSEMANQLSHLFK